MSTLSVNTHTPVNAAAGAVSMALPTGASPGSQISCEKYDTSLNAVTITGNMRGLSAQTLTLILPKELIAFRADSAGSWWPIAGHKTLGSLDARYPVISLPTPLLLHDFTASADTTTGNSGSAGTPTIGTWSGLSGGGVSTLQISGGQLVSPGGDSYVFCALGATPGRMRQRFKLTSGIGSATSAILQTGTSLSNMVHTTITSNFISLTVWTAGSSVIPVNNGGPTNGAMTLSQNVEYVFDVFVEGNTLHATVTDMSGVVMGVYDGSDAGLSALMGPTVFIEPTSGGVITYVDAYPPQRVRTA